MLHRHLSYRLRTAPAAILLLVLTACAPGGPTARSEEDLLVHPVTRLLSLALLRWGFVTPDSERLKWDQLPGQTNTAKIVAHQTFIFLRSEGFLEPGGKEGRDRVLRQLSNAYERAPRTASGEEDLESVLAAAEQVVNDNGIRAREDIQKWAQRIHVFVPDSSSVMSIRDYGSFVDALTALNALIPDDGSRYRIQPADVRSLEKNAKILADIVDRSGHPKRHETLAAVAYAKVLYVYASLADANAEANLYDITSGSKTGRSLREALYALAGHCAPGVVSAIKREFSVVKKEDRDPLRVYPRWPYLPPPEPEVQAEAGGSGARVPPYTSTDCVGGMTMRGAEGTAIIQALNVPNIESTAALAGNTVVLSAPVSELFCPTTRRPASTSAAETITIISVIYNLVESTLSFRLNGPGYADLATPGWLDEDGDCRTLFPPKYESKTEMISMSQIEGKIPYKVWHKLEKFRSQHGGM